MTSWSFNQPIRQICSWIWIISPTRGIINKHGSNHLRDAASNATVDPRLLIEVEQLGLGAQGSREIDPTREHCHFLFTTPPKFSSEFIPENGVGVPANFTFSRWRRFWKKHVHWTICFYQYYALIQSQMFFNRAQHSITNLKHLWRNLQGIAWTCSVIMRLSA